MTMEQRLLEYLENALGQEFEWGVNDCTIWPARWVESLSGVKLNIPKYSNELEARSLIERHGSLTKLWDYYLQDIATHVDRQDISCGDVCLVDTHRYGPVGVILVSDSIGYWRAETGIGPLRPREIIQNWRVT